MLGSSRLRGANVAIDEQLIALPRDRAAALAGVSERRLDYWAARGLVTPMVDGRLQPRTPVRLYDFVALMSLLVVSELRGKASLQEIRKVVGILRDRGFERPLTEFGYAVVSKRIYIQWADGSWAQGLRPDEQIIPKVVPLEAFRARIRSAADRDPATVGRIESHPRVRQSKPVIAGTRVPVDTVRRYLEHGKTEADVLEAFPVLRPEDVRTVRKAMAS